MFNRYISGQSYVPEYNDVLYIIDDINSLFIWGHSGGVSGLGINIYINSFDVWGQSGSASGMYTSIYINSLCLGR